MTFHRLFILIQVLSISLSTDINVDDLTLGNGISRNLIDNYDPESKEMFRLISPPRPKVEDDISIAKVQRYIEHLKKEGANVLRYVGERVGEGIKKILRQKVDKKIAAVIQDSETAIQTYFETHWARTLEEKGLVNDTDFMFLNLHETAFKVLYRKENKLLDDIAKAVYSNNDSNEMLITSRIDKIKEIIYDRSIKYKKEGLEYLCVEYKICKQYPAFTDYCENFIIEMLKLPDDKLNSLVQHLVDSLKNNEQFLNMISAKQDNVVLLEKVNVFYKDYSIKETLTAIGFALNQKFKKSKVENTVQRVRVQATRALLDILDAMFEGNDNNNFANTFFNAIKAVKSWDHGENLTEKSTTQLFLNTLINQMNFYLTPFKINLIKMILRNGTEHDVTLDMDASFFLEGCKGVYEFE